MQAEETDIQQNLINGYQAISKKLINWVNTLFELLPNIVVATLILVVFWYIGKLVQRTAKRFILRLTKNEAVSSLLSIAIFYFIMFEGLFLALNALHLEQTVTQLLAGAGIIGLALSFAFQSIATNIISGVIIAVQKPVRLGDLVKVGEYQGVVKEIGLRVVVLQTFLGEEVLIPSKEFIENPLVNYFLTPSRRVKISLRVSYAEDLARVRQITIESLKQVQHWRANSEIVFSYVGFGESAIDFEVFFWITQNAQPVYLEARSQAVMLIKQAFDANNIAIPFPIRSLDFEVKGGRNLDEVNFKLGDQQ